MLIVQPARDLQQLGPGLTVRSLDPLVLGYFPVVLFQGFHLLVAFLTHLLQRSLRLLAFGL